MKINKLRICSFTRAAKQLYLKKNSVLLVFIYLMYVNI